MSTGSIRAPSVQTQASKVSSVSNLIRRVWERSSHHSPSENLHGPVSPISSSSQMIFPASRGSTRQRLVRQTSTSSIKTNDSREVPFDLRSISSRRSARSIRTASETGTKSRASTKSLRGAEPPSSFHARHLVHMPSPSEGTEDRLRSAADIREEIRATEAELESVMAAFSLLNQQHGSGEIPPGAQDAWTVLPGKLPSNSDVYSDRRQSSMSQLPVDTNFRFLGQMSLLGRSVYLDTTLMALLKCGI